MSAALLDEPRIAARDNNPAANLRDSMAAVRVELHLAGHPEDPDPRAAGRGRPAVRRRGAVPLGGQEAPRHQPPGLQGGHGDQDARSPRSGSRCRLPFPEPGVRLIRRDKIEEFVGLMEEYRAELADAVANLDRHYGELKAAAAERLGRLFNPGDYPETLIGLFDVSWDFPSRRAARLPPGPEPGPVRGRACPCRRPVRRGGPAGRAGVPGGVRQAGRPPDRADQRGRRGRQAEGLPGLGGRQPRASSSSGSGR